MEVTRIIVMCNFCNEEFYLERNYLSPEVTCPHCKATIRLISNKGGGVEC